MTHIDQGVIVTLALAVAGGLWKLAKTEGRVETLYHFWESKMERRSVQDENNTPGKRKADG